MDTQTSQPFTLGKAGLVLGVSLVLGLLFDYFFYAKVPGVSFPLYVILVILGLLIIANAFRKQLQKEVVWIFALLMFFSAMVFVRSSALLTFLNIVASLLLLLVITNVSFGKSLKSFSIEHYLNIFFLPFKFINPSLQTVSDMLSSFGQDRDRTVLLQVLKGVAMTIPALVIFLLLFSSSDLIFQRYISYVITVDLEPETVFRLILIFIATIMYIGAYSYTLRRTNTEPPAEDQGSTTYSLGHIESSILLGSVNVLFFVFILVQLTYLFGGESNISSQGFTYAEYARRGFFELIAVAVVSLLLLLTIEQYIVKKAANHEFRFRILSTALIVQTVVIMASAFMRLSLYEQAYGLTTLRLYSQAFVIWLAIVFCLLLYKIYKGGRANVFAFHVFVSIASFLIAMNFLNPDALIARRNIERFADTEKLDVLYLARLSSDALPETIKLLSVSDEELRGTFAHLLYWRTQNNDAPHLSQWQSSNLSRMRAEKILHEHIEELEKYKQL